jgi:hypothetical protein
MAPMMRICSDRHPLLYLSSVNTPCALIHVGNLNQARGDTSIKNALIDMTTATITAIILATFCIN